ncbi:MAG: ABC transporter permease [Chloroflexi bacterium]|nr:ABC transporter permease [Chloroflexota bacterium]
MTEYIIRRLLLVFPTFILVTMLVFGLIRLMPGDVLFAKIGEGLFAGQRELDDLRHQMGFDRPIYVQYLDFMGGAVRGDLGRSLWSDKKVSDLILFRLPVTLELAVLAILTGLSIAIPVGVLSAVRQDTFLDYLLRSIAIGGISIPAFWLGTLILTFPAIWWGWLPPLRYVQIQDDPLRNLSQFILPALVLGTLLSASVMRMTRSMMLEVLRQDYVRTARSKGLQERTVIFRHALKNAMLPVWTVVGLQIAFLIGGTVIIESIFALPGLGTLLLEAIRVRDWPVIQGLNLFFTAWVLLVNLAVDIGYGIIDPRIRFATE